jgi:hypothetical protein
VPVPVPPSKVSGLQESNLHQTQLPCTGLLAGDVPAGLLRQEPPVPTQEVPALGGVSDVACKHPCAGRTCCVTMTCCKQRL